MIEIWKPVKGFENYEVSNLGQVKSLNYNRTKGTKILKPGMDTNGYLQVHLSKNGKHYAKSIHRLVAEAFIPNIDNKPEVNHIDGNKQNNKVENLEWVTRRENNKHAYDTGLLKPPVMKGEENPRARKVICTNTGEIFNYIKEAAKKYNVIDSSISACCKGKLKSAGKLPTGEKLVWRYAEDLREKIK